jgi:hypothetical protein
MNDVSLFRNDTEFSSALLASETRLRREYILVEAPPCPQPRTSQPRIARVPQKKVAHKDLLRDSAAFLELLVVLVAWFEAAEELGLSTLGEALHDAARLDRVTRAITGYDPAKVVKENVHRFPAKLLRRTPDPATPMRAETFIRYGEVALATCPIVGFEVTAARIGAPELGHRCRKAFDWLAASTRRVRLKRDDVGRVVGGAYRDGRLSVYEVAGAMGVPVVDAIAFLDEHGFARSVDKLRLDEGERARVLDAMRRDRIERKGSALPNAHDVAVRTVIASQRIEDVDARRWLPPRS